MADEKVKSAKKADEVDNKKLSVSKNASIDFPVKVVATEADPYHETGTVFEAGKKKAIELIKRGWVTPKNAKEFEEKEKSEG